MSRTLRRPMFRGGKIDSRGSGITSGLGYNSGGRVGFQYGGTSQNLSLTGSQIYDLAQRKFANQGITDPRLMSDFRKTFKLNPKSLYTDVEGLFKDRGVMDKTVQDVRYPEMETFTFEDLLKSGEQLKSEALERSKGIDTGGDDDTYVDPNKLKKLVDDKVVPENEAIEILKKQEDDIKKTLPQIKEKGDDKNIGTDGATEKEESVEYTIKDYIKMLGGDKARRRDLGDMFARASASFLGTGGVKEGLAEFMKSEAAAGPSRREKIEQAAATLDIKDKIASKRAAENLKQTLAGIDYKIGATMAANKAATSLEGKSWIDSLKLVKESLFKTSDKGLDSASVIEETLRLKYQKPVRKYTVSSETEIPKLEVQEGFSIITLPDGSKKIFEVVEGQAKERTDLRV